MRLRFVSAGIVSAAAEPSFESLPVLGRNGDDGPVEHIDITVRYYDKQGRRLRAAHWRRHPIKDLSLTSQQEKQIKIGAKFVSHGRYVAFQMAEDAIPRTLFADILRMIAELRPPPAASTA